jgi:tripartite-type tricarboxylate transporter receptor subunit TctC
MRAPLGQPVIVENTPGAGGTTGVIRGTKCKCRFVLLMTAIE